MAPVREEGGANGEGSGRSAASARERRAPPVDAKTPPQGPQGPRVAPAAMRAATGAAASSPAQGPFSSPRVRAASYGMSNELLLAMDQDDLARLWRREAADKPALTPRRAEGGGGDDGGEAVAEVELALSAKVSLAQTKGGVVRRMLV